MKRGAWAADGGDLFERADGVVCSHASGHGRGEGFAGVLVGDGQDPHWASVVGLVSQEVDRPDMVRVGSRDMTRHPSSSPSLAGLCGQAQALIAPQPLDALSVAQPAFAAQDDVDPPIPVAGMLPCEQPQALSQERLVGHSSMLVALRRAVLTDHLAGSPLGHPETTLQSAGCSAASLRG